MKYKISEVSKILNIPIDTIRFYEKIGIITPKKDEKTDYRFFDNWDINYLLEYRKYRQMDFSAEQIRQLIYQADHKTFLDLYSKQQQKIKKKAVYYHLLDQKTSHDLERLKKLNFGFSVVSLPKRYCFFHRKNFEYFPSTFFHDIFDSWMESYALLDNTVMIRKQNLFSEKNHFEWGFSIGIKESNFLNLPVTEQVEILPSGLYVNVLIDAGERGNFSNELLQPAFEFAKANNYQINGDAFGKLLARFTDEKFHRYIDFFIPIEKK